ncbi:MarR family winged helix-turn-helix transcriptional regulator [uncultured Olegusella sp.]|uniref:MarR family winged helix-turn-helix transcriptional regulator n=1 Tax=uncultured Olegusella sp. TaxID=1979846 RepID=UPI0026183A18|nr:MarR family transcriptional regulator [uncultured Olegusella sp.]
MLEAEDEKNKLASLSTECRVLRNFGYFGFFLHHHAGGRAGKPYILIALRQAGGSLPQRELLNRAGTAAASLSEVLTKLENEKLIERKPLEHDGRQREVILTVEGNARAEEINAKHEAFIQQSLYPLSDEEKTQLAEMLDRISAHWHEIEDQERAM